MERDLETDLAGLDEVGKVDLVSVHGDPGLLGDNVEHPLLPGGHAGGEAGGGGRPARRGRGHGHRGRRCEPVLEEQRDYILGRFASSIRVTQHVLDYVLIVIPDVPLQTSLSMQGHHLFHLLVIYS